MQIDKNKVMMFALAGNATLTIKSQNTMKHFTYNITQSKQKEELYFVKLLHGPDNSTDYKYVGCFYSDNEYFHPCKQYQTLSKRNWPSSMQAIAYFFANIHKLPDNLLVYNEGKCARCGRKLTTPESIELGFGPECMRSVNI